VYTFIGDWTMAQGHVVEFPQINKTMKVYNYTVCLH